jgi:hypothetical protein
VPQQHGDWLWQALQHRTPFSSVEYPQADLPPSTSTIAPPQFSPFAAPLPVCQSSIKPYFLYQDCDADTLSLFTGLHALVRYHRIRGLAALHSSGSAIPAGGKKGAAKKSAADSSASSTSSHSSSSPYHLYWSQLAWRSCWRRWIS